MKAILLRVGIDKGTDGTLAPIFQDGSFEYVPISEGDSQSKEDRTYKNTIGRAGKPLSTYLPRGIESRTMHFDPEFETFTYGDPTSKRNYLLKLREEDILIFYAGLSPFQNDKHKIGLYIIGYFTVKNVLDFNHLSQKEIEIYHQLYPNNAHLKRSYETEGLVIIVGDKIRSKLLNKAVLISQPEYDKRGRTYHAVSSMMEELLGISGSIQRSIPPRVITEEHNLKNLQHILGME